MSNSIVLIWSNGIQSTGKKGPESIVSISNRQLQSVRGRERGEGGRYWAETLLWAHGLEIISCCANFFLNAFD